MSIYRFKLSDYHAIKEADIIIDGITVLAGENGCGKSTLSRWLYYLVNGSHRMNEFLYYDYIGSIYNRIRRWDGVTSEFSRHLRQGKEDEDILSGQAPKQMLRQLRSKENIEEQDAIQASDFFIQWIHQLGNRLEQFLVAVPEGPRRDRVLSYLNLDEYKKQPGNQIAENFVNENIRMLQWNTTELQTAKALRRNIQFFDIVQNNYNETDEAPNHMQLYEDNVELLSDESVSTLFNLQRAIYIDTPMALMNEFTDNKFWEELRKLILSDGRVDDINTKKILRRIKNIIHGEAKIVADTTPFGNDELRYISADSLINIEIEKTATGFKTFSYIQRLLEKGLLNNETLLMIDEPEAHLHPQWIVEYARLLVLMSKELGLKVMLASHNPDMVAAIKAVAERENMIQHTHFYLATPSQCPNQYVYQDLGSEISEIFKSFNIALSRIEAYGPRNL